jgi:hypothetical protein
LGGPQFKVENFHLKYTPAGCNPSLTKYGENILILRNVIGLRGNWVKLRKEKLHDTCVRRNIRVTAEDEMGGAGTTQKNTGFGQENLMGRNA